METTRLYTLTVTPTVQRDTNGSRKMARLGVKARRQYRVSVAVEDFREDTGDLPSYAIRHGNRLRSGMTV